LKISSLYNKPNYSGQQKFNWPGEGTIPHGGGYEGFMQFTGVNSGSPGTGGELAQKVICQPGRNGSRGDGQGGKLYR